MCYFRILAARWIRISQELSEEFGLPAEKFYHPYTGKGASGQESRARGFVYFKYIRIRQKLRELKIICANDVLDAGNNLIILLEILKSC